MLELDILPIPVFNQSGHVPIALLILNALAISKQEPAIRRATLTCQCW